MDLKLKGFSALEKELEKLSKAAGKGTLRRALKKASVPIADAANNYAPVGDTGEYAQSFVYSTKLTKRQASQHRRMFRDERASVEGFVGTEDPAGVQQEFGNMFHPPQPALRPAWDQEALPTLDRLGVHLWAEVQKSVGRATRKAAKG